MLERKRSELRRRISGIPIMQAFKPSSDYYRFWWIFTTLCALVTSIFTPWEVAFTNKPGLNPYDDGPAIIEYLLTSVFVIDIVIQLSLAFINKGDKFDNSRTAIAHHYLHFMFWVDLIGVIPFSTLVKVSIESEQDHRSLTLLRLIRLVRAHRLLALFRDFEINTHFNQIVITLTRNMTIVFLVAHCAACAFYYIAREYGFDEDTWIGANLELISDPMDDSREDISGDNWKKYAYCIYWSITTMTTVGYGDYSPKNIAEVIFATIYMVINIVLNSYILGTITLVVIRTDETTSNQRKGYEKLEKFAKMNSVSPETLMTLRNHLRYNYLHPDIKDSNLMDHLPSNIRRKVLNELYGEKLAQSPIFEKCSKNFITALLESNGSNQSICVETYLPTDEIVTSEDVVSTLHVLLSGDVLSCKKLHELSAFPLEPFTETQFQDTLHFAPETITAKTICNVLRIPYKSVHSALEQFPEDRINFNRAVKSHLLMTREHQEPSNSQTDPSTNVPSQSYTFNGSISIESNPNK